MKFKKIINKKDELFLLENFIENKIIVLLSDTIYGISSLLRDVSIDKIYKIKNRDKTKPFILLFSDLEMLKKYVFLNKKQEVLIKDNFLNKKERPASFILTPRENITKLLGEAYKNSIAVRLPKSKFLIKIIKLIKEPIISTSCNISGEKSLNNLKDIKNFFEKRNYRPDLIISTPYLRPKKKASKLVDIRDINNVKNIRN